MLLGVAAFLAKGLSAPGRAANRADAATSVPRTQPTDAGTYPPEGRVLGR